MWVCTVYCVLCTVYCVYVVVVVPRLQVRSRRMGHAINVGQLMDDIDAGLGPDPVVTASDMLDRVRSGGHFTGMAVFVAPVVAPYVRLLGVYKHGFGTLEGSHGGVGVALGLYDVTVAFVGAQLSFKKATKRRTEYMDLCERLGKKLGGRGFQLNEQFHHIVWMGDLGYKTHTLKADQAVRLVSQGRHREMMVRFDELNRDLEDRRILYEFHEPNHAPDFMPTYRKHTTRCEQRVPTSSSKWAKATYNTQFQEAFYLGGRCVWVSWLLGLLGCWVCLVGVVACRGRRLVLCTLPSYDPPCAVLPSSR